MTESHLTEMPVDFWCSELAQTSSESAAGTAVLAETWILLEMPGGWMPRAFEDSDMAPDVKVYLEAALGRLPGGRIQFIKHTDSRDRQTRSLYIARSQGDGSMLYRLEFRDLSDLLSLPFTEDWLQTLTPIDEPLYLVCTHGTRDRCCARFGMAVFNTLSAYRPGQVWQSSHLGGHRFAANLACLPEGLLYGYVSPETVSTLIDTHEAGRVDASLLRGRSSYSKPVQAAEAYLWQELGDELSGPVRLLSENGDDNGSSGYQVVFQLADNRMATIALQESEPVYENYVSCGAAKSKPVTHYQLVKFEVR